VQAIRPRPAPRDTRRQVIDAAVETIVEVGFDLASSREILRRAGFTWGVLQYHFGSREGLLLAVLEDGANHFNDIVTDLVSSPAITHGPVEERLTTFFAALDSFYGTAQYIATLEIIFNLSHNPATSAKTLELLRSIADRSQTNLTRILEHVVGPQASTPDVARLVFHASRGQSLSNVIGDMVDYGDDATGRADATERDAQRRLLARAIASLIER
jgi:AcrR family transcriptional regulator